MERVEKHDEAPDNGHTNESNVQLRGDGVSGEPSVVLRRQKRISRGWLACEPVGRQFIEHVARALPEVRNFDEIGKDVIAVVAQQRVAVHEHGADRANDYDV
jgi:hypothetical protein